MNSISKFKASLAIGFALLLGAGSPTAYASSESGSERIVEKDFSDLVKSQEFSQVVLDGKMNLKFTQGPVPSLVMRGSQEAIENVTASTDGIWLILKDINKDITISNYDVEAYLTLPEVIFFNLRGSGNLDFNNTFNGQYLGINTYGSGNVDIPNMSVTYFSVISTGTGNVKCSGKTENMTIHLTGTGDVNANLTVESISIVESKGTGDVNLIGKTQSANILTEGTGDINARGFKAENVTVRSFGTGDVACYASQDFKGSKNSLSSVTCYGGPRNRNHIDGIVFPKVNETAESARMRQKEEEKSSDYAELISKNKFALATRKVRESGDYENGKMLIFNDGKIAMLGDNDNRENWHRNDMRVHIYGNGNVEFIYIDKEGYLIKDIMSKQFVNNLMASISLNGSDAYVAEKKLRDSEKAKNRAATAKNRAEINKNLAEIEKHRAEIESNRTELEESRAELARVRAELAREREALERQRNATINRSTGSTAQSRKQALDDARRKIHEKKQEQYRAVMEKAQQEYRQAMEKAQQEYRLIQQKAEEEYLKVKQEAEKSYNEVVESEYVETETSNGTRYSTEDNVELKYDTRANKWVMYIDGVKVDRKVKSVSPSQKASYNKTTRQVEKNAKAKTAKGRRQTGVWENGSERTIFFEDGGQVTIFTDENGRQRIINEE